MGRGDAITDKNMDRKIKLERRGKKKVGRNLVIHDLTGHVNHSGL